jgi:hypothetical protein
MARADVTPEFTEEERARMHKVCRALRTSYKEFIHFAVMQSITELEGYANDYEAIHRYYQGEM